MTNLFVVLWLSLLCLRSSTACFTSSESRRVELKTTPRTTTPRYSTNVLTYDQENVYRNPLEVCSLDPLTGPYRDGFCRTDEFDQGLHTVCATITQQYLDYSRSQGYDLATPRGSFPGLGRGDRWCLCARRWKQAYLAGYAPKVHLTSTHIQALEINPFDVLHKFDDSVFSDNQ